MNASLMLRNLLAAEAKFVVRTEPEDFPFEGNVQCSEDEESDKATEDEVRAQLKAGNDAAWCMVIVEAHWQGVFGRDVLGGVSIFNGPDMQKELDEVVESHGMKANALADLNKELREMLGRLRPLLLERLELHVALEYPP